jgi:hypothetical protein
MTTHTFTIEFEEIPLAREADRKGFLVSGEAEITVFDEGQWFVTAILDNGCELNRNSEAFRTIAAELEVGGWKKVIEDRVQDFIEEHA